MGRSAYIALGVAISVYLVLGAAEAGAQNGVCRNSHSDPKNPNCSAAPKCKCNAQGQVDRFTKEGARTLGIVKQQLAAAAEAWAQCSQASQRAGTLWQACKDSYQSEYDNCLQTNTQIADWPWKGTPIPARVTKSICDAQLNKHCANTPSPEQNCQQKIAEYDRLNNQRSELEQDLAGLQKLHFQCPPGGQCPKLSRTHNLYPDRYSETLCGTNSEGKVNDAVVDNLTDMATGKPVGHLFMNCTPP
jgi:hypothetical protein